MPWWVSFPLKWLAMLDPSKQKWRRVPLDEEGLDGAGREEIMSALFESFVTQQGSLGLSLLGELPGVDGATQSPDLENAKLVIDQLEMLEHKSRGNLSPEEAAFLRKTVTVLREAFAVKLDLLRDVDRS